MVLLLVLLLVALIILIAIELINISVVGFPPKDEDVLEFINKLRNSNPYLLDGNERDSLITSNGNPFISKGIQTCLMGCYINDVGAIPRWYKSYGEIQKLYIELGARGKMTKREKLGL